MTLSSSHDMLRKVDATLSQRFEDIAAACPRRPAVHADASTCSYDALNRLANRLAHALIARGATPGCRIALLMSRGLPQIAAMIAALKAGGVVVALNATDSTERLREIVADAEPMLLVTDKEHRSRAAEIGGNGSMPSICRQHDVQEVFISSSKFTPERIAQILEDCRRIGVLLRRLQIRLDPLTEIRYQEPQVLRAEVAYE